MTGRVMIKKNKAQIEKLNRKPYCPKCKVYLLPEYKERECPECGGKIKVVYKED